MFPSRSSLTPPPLMGRSEVRQQQTDGRWSRHSESALFCCSHLLSSWLGPSGHRRHRTKRPSLERPGRVGSGRPEPLHPEAGSAKPGDALTGQTSASCSLNFTQRRHLSLRSVQGIPGRSRPPEPGGETRVHRVQPVHRVPLPHHWKHVPL